MLKVDNCNFVNNSADKGGAIFADYDATVTNSIFTGNSAAANGGAIMFDYRGRCLCESLTLTGSTFTDNTAGSNGGAIFCDSMNYLTMSDVEFRKKRGGILMLLKRILSAALAAAAILAFAGCGKSSDSSAKAESSQTETQQQTTDQTTTAKPATTNASADKSAEKPVPGKLYALNQNEGDAPAISALKLNGNQVGTEEGVNGWKASADKIRFVFEQSEWIELYPQTEQTSGLAAYLVPHSDDAATYTDTFVAALNDDVPNTELTKPEEQGAAWGSFYAHPEVNAPGYYDLIITSGMKPVAMVMVRIYPEGGLSDYDDAKLEQLMNNESSAAIQ